MDYKSQFLQEWDTLTGGTKQGQISLYTSGRQTGKSVMNHLYAEMVNNKVDWESIIRGDSLQWLPNAKPKPKSPYQFSRQWHIGQFRWQDQQEVYQWCQENFGPMPRTPDAWSRWKTMPANQIAFRDEGDFTLFLLRWV
jgi:hypothetical protein